MFMQLDIFRPNPEASSEGPTYTPASEDN